MKKLGNRPGCNVYLAEHEHLHIKRIIKCIDKSQPLSQYFLREAFLLKSLIHPNIPVLYDYKEDSDFAFLIEEYIKGESLKSLKETHVNFSQLQLITIAKDLCRVFMYLHNLKPYPVLYLDLKPEHIIITEKGLKLIDFGSAITKKGDYVTVASKGTRGFTSPEQIEGRDIDERADIYSLGAVLFWIMTGKTAAQRQTVEMKHDIKAGYSGGWNNIVCKCISKSRAERYQCIDLLAKDIWFLEKRKQNKNPEKSATVAILGSQSHIGATHLAIALTVFFNRSGSSCLYEEKNESGALHQLYEYRQDIVEYDGLYYDKDFTGIPRYGKTVYTDKNSFSVSVQDYGSYQNRKINEFEQADYKIIILGIKEWEINKSKKVIRYAGQQMNSCFLFAPAALRQCRQALSELGLSNVYQMTTFKNPFEPGKVEHKLFREMQQRQFPLIKKRNPFYDQR